MEYGLDSNVDLTYWLVGSFIIMHGACRHEFHRRLKVYHAWKAKNARKTTMADQERAPQSIMDAAKSPRVPQKGEILGARHRYFRIPFVRAGGAAGADAERRGWWYAHFDGQYVARQMELHPDKTPVLLQADTTFHQEPSEIRNNVAKSQSIPQN
ncbi:hypothetical protein HF086_012902 [Spodoptera exigua]|uniref:Myosin VI cargo binding domain-containing protein n=1 Tax=Spodoptera exigua TaxID=7107 RepID=A0A922MTK5_SPOEX|nr:hypothetical protein HF086_012902 [Spodoptera exigua]